MDANPDAPRMDDALQLHSSGSFRTVHNRLHSSKVRIFQCGRVVNRVGDGAGKE